MMNDEPTDIPPHTQNSLIEIPRWRRIALASLIFLTIATIGFVQPFVPLYMEASGLTRNQIGWVTGLATGLALLIQPLLGWLSDRWDTRRLPMCLAALAAGCAYMTFRLADRMPTFLILAALGSNALMFLSATGGVLVGRMVTTRAQGGAAYAGYRVWGSVGYIVVSLLTGWLIGGRGGATAMGRENLAQVFLWGPILYFLIAAVALLVPDPSHSPVSTVSRASDTETEAYPVSEDLLTGNHLTQNLRYFFLAFFLYQFGLYGATAYLALYLKSLGATPLWVTGTFAAGVVCEVLVMAQVGRLTDRFGRRPAMAVAFLILPVRLLLCILATSPAWVLAVQSLHGLNFGIMGAIAVVFINDLATNTGRGFAQARLSATQGLATALGPIVCGWIAERYGIGWMFGAMSGVGALGAAVFLCLVQESHPSPEALVGRGPVVLQPLWRLLATPLKKI